MSSSKVDGAVGVITFSIAGVTGVLDAASAEAWGHTLLNLAPLLLIIFVIWRMMKLDSSHKECQRKYDKISEQLLLTYAAMKAHTPAHQLPTVREFKENEFDLQETVGKVEKI